MVVETAFLAFTLGTFCGPFYLANMAVTMGLYVKFTRDMGKVRTTFVRNNKDI